MGITIFRKILPKGFRRKTQSLKKNPEGTCYRAQALKEESQRDFVTQPRVARPRETLGKSPHTHNPKGVASMNRENPF